MYNVLDLTKGYETRSGLKPVCVYDREIFGNMIVGTLPGRDQIVTWAASNGAELNGNEELDLVAAPAPF